MALNSNAKQSIPKLFLEIMKHDLDEPPVPLLAGPVADISPWRIWQFKHRRWKERQRQLIKSAEEALRWNTDKGQ